MISDILSTLKGVDFLALYFVNITPEIRKIIQKSGVKEGYLSCQCNAHLKRQVMGREVVVAITKGQLDFGPWEQIFYGEFDGKRPKRVLVKVIGE